MSGGNQAAVRELAERIDQADAVVIGGGSGLSSAAGYDHYHWSPALAEALAPFRECYGFTSPLAGFYHCFSSYGEQWGYYSQYIRFLWEAPTGQPYLDLQALVADKPAFVLTTNVDRQFFRVFPEEQICAFQGDFGYCQCSQPCRDAIWENQELVKELTGRLVGVRLPEDAVPRCPDCGRVLVPWVRDDTFLEGGAWKAQVDRYHAFLRRRLIELHEKYPALGLDSLYRLLKPEFGCSRKRVHRQMRLAGISSVRRRAYKKTTHILPLDHSYNKDTVKGTAASRVFFHLRAEAVRMREEWPDLIDQGPARPQGSPSAAFLIRSIRFAQVVPPAFGAFVSTPGD